MASWLSWLERRPVTAEVVSSSLIWVVSGVLAQLGEHLPYKQGVTGSSPVGPIELTKVSSNEFSLRENIEIVFNEDICRRGGTGRRAGLKILL